MRVRLITAAAGLTDATASRGDVIEVSRAEGRELVRIGAAVEVPEVRTQMIEGTVRGRGRRRAALYGII